MPDLFDLLDELPQEADATPTQKGRSAPVPKSPDPSVIDALIGLGDDDAFWQVLRSGYSIRVGAEDGVPFEYPAAFFRAARPWYGIVVDIEKREVVAARWMEIA